MKSPLIRISTDYYRLCYSLHSSYPEICTFVKQISPTRVHPIALPDRITNERLNELLRTLGIHQCSHMSFAPNNTVQQIKRRYHLVENENDENDLDFTCDENREQNEKQLFKRLSNLQQQNSSIKKRKNILPMPSDRAEIESQSGDCTT